jgi:hypothetical protein
MDRMGVSGTLDPGSIPGGATSEVEAMDDLHGFDISVWLHFTGMKRTSPEV